ncbi:MAG: DUF1499 domain-containing protein [Thermostichales cyanobacterium SZTDM-1c_bins_54]
MLRILLVIVLMGWLALPVAALTLKPGNSAVREVTLPVPPGVAVQLVQESLRVWPRGELLKTRYEDRDPAGPHWIVKGLSRTNFFKFEDDIEVDITADPGDAGVSHLRLVSVGRQGEYDFGGNDRNLKELLKTLEGLRDRS